MIFLSPVRARYYEEEKGIIFKRATGNPLKSAKKEPLYSGQLSIICNKKSHLFVT